MEEILWNDPREEIGNEDAWEYSRRGIGKHFGVEISRKWLRLSGTKVIVRGTNLVKDIELITVVP